MSTPNHAAAHHEEENYLTHDTSIQSWLFTRDHKRIAILYFLSVTIFFTVGGLFASLVRIELLTPAGDFMTAEMYNQAFTSHGVMMIFFFLIPAVPAVLGNFLIPLMIGAKDLALPRINLASWYIFIIGASLAVFAVLTGGLDTGWTLYPPYSSAYSQSQVTIAVAGVFIAGFASILTGVNFIATVHRMRAPGLTWFRLPLFVWAHYATSLVMVLGTPVVAITLFLLGLERTLGFGFFDPAKGGDPVLFQHLFWFYSHPAVYIMILPAMGVISEIISTFSRQKLFGYSFVAMSSLAIAILGFLVWGHHMFTTSQSAYTGILFSALTFLVAIPSAIKAFNWTATLYKGSVSWETPMLFAFGFMGLFLIGGLTGLFLATMGMDIHLQDTYFVVSHFHYVMVGGGVMGYMGGIHFWWPKMTGRMYSNFWSKLSALFIFAGFNFTFFPQFILGYMGMPRRYHSYPEEWQVLNVMSTLGASILAIGYLLPAIYLTHSLFMGKKAPANPWGATGLEWQTASPPPPHNFHETPTVTTEAYDYQSLPLSATPEKEGARHV